jgi:hypothetical protein
MNLALKCFGHAIWQRCSALFSEFVVLGVFSRFLPFRHIGIRHNGRSSLGLDVLIVDELTSEAEVRNLTFEIK